MIFVGIDDTDVIDSPGTNKLACRIVERIAPDFETDLILRHQLLFDPRIPYTSHNSSASLTIRPRPGAPGLSDLVDRLRSMMVDGFLEGSDPGLCALDGAVPAAIREFGRRCQREIVAMDEALGLARASGIVLEPLGGTGGGVIGALAAIGLAATGDDGRVIRIGQQPDDLTGVQAASTILSRGVHEIRDVETRARIDGGAIDLGKKLRPNRLRGRIILHVRRAPEGEPSEADWRAVRLP